MTIAARAPQPRWLLVTMIVMSVGYVGLFAFSILAAVVSPLVFDSGGTAKNWQAFFAFLAFPLLILGCVAMAWCGYRFRQGALIPTGFTLPLVYCVVFYWYFS